jgi:hypothetical protein
MVHGLGRFWDEKMEVLYQHLLGGTEKNTKNVRIVGVLVRRIEPSTSRIQLYDVTTIGLSSKSFSLRYITFRFSGKFLGFMNHLIFRTETWSVSVFR